MAIYVGQATAIVFRTLPFLLLRGIVYTLFALLSLLYVGVSFLIGKATAPIHPYLPFVIWFLALVGSFPIVRFLREYLLYIVKAGHVAVIAELAIRGKLPEGVSQIQWGREQVQKRFKATSVLFLVDRLVVGVIRSINGMMWKITSFLRGVPGVGGLVKLANIVLYFSLTYVDESILARNFIKTDENIWKSAQTGVVLYAQSWRQILTTALVLGLVSIIVWPVLFFLLLTPALGVGQMWPALQLPAIIAAVLFSWVLKAVLLDPWTLANMILVYLKTTENMTPNAEWEEKLASVSKKFRQLKEKTVQTATTGTPKVCKI